MIDNCKNILIELNVKYKNFEKYFIEIIRTYVHLSMCICTVEHYQHHHISYNF